MNHNAVVFGLAVALYAAQIPVWVFWANEWRGAVAALVGALIAYLLYRWSAQ